MRATKGPAREDSTSPLRPGPASAGGAPALAGILLPLLLFLGVMAAVQPGITAASDLAVTIDLQTLITGWLTAGMLAITALGGPLGALATVGVGAGLLWWRRLRTEAILIVAAGGGHLLARGFKYLWARPRPAGTLVRVLAPSDSPSFPSGHATYAMACFGLLAYLAWRYHGQIRWGRAAATALGVLVLLMGVSRVYLGAHWASDIIAGYLLGFAWLSVLVLVHRRWQPDPTAWADRPSASG